MWTVVFCDGREPIYSDMMLSWAEAELFAHVLNDLCLTDVYLAAPVPCAA